MTIAEFTGDPGEAAPRGFRWWRVSPDGELYSAWSDVAWDPLSNEATCALPVSRLTRRAWTWGKLTRLQGPPATRAPARATLQYRGG